MVRASSELTEKHLASSIAMGFLRGQQRALSNVGPKAMDAIRQINEVFSPLPPIVPPLSELLGLGDEPDIVFPMLDTAAESLATRRVMTSDDYYRLAANAKQEAFTITADVTENTLAKVRDILGRVATESTSIEQFETLVAAEIGELPISGSHLEQVYRNAVNSAFSQGQNAVLSHPVVEDGFPYRAYYAIHDARARHEHRELESLGLSGTNIYHKDDPVWKEFEPPWSWSCFLPGTIVGGVFDTGFKSWYEGEAIKIVTARGHVLSVTVNHPVLTPSGFVPAGLLNEGDYAIADVRNADARLDSRGARVGAIGIPATLDSILSSPNLNKEYAPAVIEEVFRALSKLGQMARVKVGPADFHGDSERFNGDVEVVTIDRVLLCDIATKSLDSRCDFSLAFMDARESIGPGFRHPDDPLSWDFTASDSLPCCGALTLDKRPVLFDLAPLKQLRVGPASRLNASLFESAANAVTADSKNLGNSEDGFSGVVEPRYFCGIQLQSGELIATDDIDSRVLQSGGDSIDTRDSNLARNLLERHAGIVEADEIVSVERFSYAGHVYDLRSKNGWVNASGIYASNCRCGWVALSIEDAASAGVVHAKQWLAAVERAELDDTFTGRLADYMPQDGWRVSVPDFRPDPKWARGYI